MLVGYSRNFCKFEVKSTKIRQPKAHSATSHCSYWKKNRIKLNISMGVYMTSCGKFNQLREP